MATQNQLAPMKDGLTVTKKKYIRIKAGPWRDQYLHRVIAETVLGRPLKGYEVVHHKNGDTLDCRPENLQVMTKLEHDFLHANGNDQDF